MKKVLAAALVGGMLTACTTKSNNELNELNELNSMNTTLTLTQEWDKTFPKSEKVDHKKVTFRNRYGIELAADMYTPKNAEGKLAAIAVSGPRTIAQGLTSVPVVSSTRCQRMHLSS